MRRILTILEYLESDGKSMERQMFFPKTEEKTRRIIGLPERIHPAAEERIWADIARK